MNNFVIFKTCFKCKISKNLCEFHLYKKAKDGHKNICKLCRKLEEKNYYLKHKEKIKKRVKQYNKSHQDKRKLAKKVYRLNYSWFAVLERIKQRCNNKNVSNYKYYGGRGIRCLITAEELKKLWYRDKAYLMKTPSIDRIDNDGHYIYENCRFIEMKDNSKKSKIENLKRVLQYDLEGHFIKEWKSVFQIAQKLRISKNNFYSALSGHNKTACNFIWKYKLKEQEKIK